jgi:Xaa-Pro aminopeptidase
MVDTELIDAKVEQASERLAELGIDAWLIFARETSEIPEPALALVVGADIVWETAIVITAAGDNHAVVGRHDAPAVEDLDAYDVHEYDESIREPLRSVLVSVDPERIAIDYAPDEQVADGLTHGMYRKLTEYLSDTPYVDRLESAGPVVSHLRRRLIDAERNRMYRAIEYTQSFYDEVTDAWEPDWTEADVASYLHRRLREEGLETAWGADHCPAVDAGSEAPIGHGHPGDRTLPPGELLHLDFGVRYDQYASDIQRLYYYPSEDQPRPPDALQTAFEDVRASIEAAFDSLEPGIAGHEVDAVARETLTARDWLEYKHATGHTVGRNAHDAGPLLGPQWERYGDRPKLAVQDGDVYTLELGVETEWGYVGLEEMIEVTDEGARYLSTPQTELRLLSAQSDSV